MKTLSPDPFEDMSKVLIGDIALSYRQKDGGGRHYLGRGHSEEYLSRFYPVLREALAPEACIDIGANYGYTGLLMRRYFPQAHLTMVEPIPWLEGYVRYNFDQNLKEFDVFHSAICSVDTQGTRSSFGVWDVGTQDSRVIGQTGTRTIETDVVTLDGLATDLGAEQGVYIKIDTQGWEERVFASGAKFLDTHSKWFIKTEFAPQWLESQGTDAVALLRYLLERYAVHESVGRVGWSAQSLSDVIGPPVQRGNEHDFVNYIRNLALSDKGWIDLYILPPVARRAYDVSAMAGTAR
jgi:FkbM family methyltransferase